MKNKHSWTRIDYEHCYRQMRRGDDFDGIITTTPIFPQIVRAADYSYQAKSYDVHGWSNDARRKRFHAIKYRAFAFAEDIPF